MVQLEESSPAVRYLPNGFTLTVAVAGMLGAWLLVVAGLVGSAVLLQSLSWSALLPLVVLCGGLLPACWATRQVTALRRVRARVPEPLLAQRRFVDFAAVTADEARPLRPVGMALTDVVACTDTLLGDLHRIPSVRIFQGVRPAGSSRPMATHAVSAGRMLVLVESVAWPPGAYRMAGDGRVCCDGEYIGQTIRPLSSSVRACRALLPRNHQVSALVVVHRTASGDYTLPASSKELGWALAEDLPSELHTRLGRHRSTVSRHIIAALTEPRSAP